MTTTASIDALTQWAQFYWPAGLGQLRVNDPEPLRQYHRTAAALRAAAAALTAHRSHLGDALAFDAPEALAVADEHWPISRTRPSDRERASVSVARDHDVAAALRAAVAELKG